LQQLLQQTPFASWLIFNPSSRHIWINAEHPENNDRRTDSLALLAEAERLPEPMAGAAVLIKPVSVGIAC